MGDPNHFSEFESELNRWVWDDAACYFSGNQDQADVDRPRKLLSGPSHTDP